MFRDRVDFAALKSTSDEYRLIVVGIGLFIVHEIAHLLLRWQNVTESPSQFDEGEVGRYLEKYAFGFGHDTYIMALKDNEDTEDTTLLFNQASIYKQIV
jgi:hypothetical protein